MRVKYPVFGGVMDGAEFVAPRDIELGEQVTLGSAAYKVTMKNGRKILEMDKEA